MAAKVTGPRRCPICGKTYYERPALSRRDKHRLICPDCGTREALEDYEAAQSGDVTQLARGACDAGSNPAIPHSERGPVW